MEIIETPLNDCFIIKNKVFGDERGFFLESFNKERFKEVTALDFDVKQINFAKSQKYVLRGLHYQLNPYSQSKLVGVINGSVLDVVVDLRKSSSTFGKKFELKIQDQATLLFVPMGFGHGYEVLSDETIFYYGVDNFYNPENERGLAYNDPKLQIGWVNPQQNIISEKDKNHPVLEKAELNF